MKENMKVWDAVKQPPKFALRQIQGGRLAGKTDINPQWRYQVMTEQFGVCGVGWYYEVKRVWSEPGSEGQVFAFAEIYLYAGSNVNPIPGIGGSMLIEKEKGGLHSNDEGYKMAITDALSVAMKMLGVAADIYAGLWDGTKYKDTEKPKPEPPQEPTEATKETQAAMPSEAMKSPDEIDISTVTKCNNVLNKLYKELDWKPENLKAQLHLLGDKVSNKTDASLLTFAEKQILVYAMLKVKEL